MSVPCNCSADPVNFWVGLAINLGLGLVVGLLFYGLQRLIARATPHRPGESRLPPMVAATGILCGAFGGFMLGIGLLGRMSPARDDFWYWIGLLVACGVGGLYFVIAAGNWRMWPTEQGLQLRNDWGQTGPFVPWRDFKRIRPNTMQMMVFERRSGRPLKIPFQIAGLLEAAEAAHAHGAAIDDQLLSEIRRVRDAMNQDERNRR